jgi:hypothetical protein
MSATGDSVRRSLVKRQEAVRRFRIRREDFLLEKKRITKDIEEAREIWKKTLEQLPDHDFNL